MPHAPGSFSKNFAWHGTGLRKLHTAIKAGFSGALSPVSRTTWRQNSGIPEPGLDLIPVNFFLHNKSGEISVDELVFRAINRKHSLNFDRLALFAFHLNQAGSGTGVIARPAMWANEFVRESLWQDGAWRSSALTDEVLDKSISTNMQAKPAVRIKGRNNYRHLFELCGYWPTSLPIINTGASDWIASALFLAWDRHILDGNAHDKRVLLELVESDELHKLLGTSEKIVREEARSLVELYIAAGMVSRLQDINDLIKREPDETSTDTPNISNDDCIEQAESDEVVERRLVERLDQKRNRKKAAAIKQKYDNRCLFCDQRLQIGSEKFYSEAAHIKPLGKPHQGPDKYTNMIVLCPNHHLQFDKGILTIQNIGGEYYIKSKVSKDPLHDKPLKLLHPVGDAFIEWHYKWFSLIRK